MPLTTKSRSARGSTWASACSCSPSGRYSPPAGCTVGAGRRASVPVGGGQPGLAEGGHQGKGGQRGKGGWAQRLLAEPRLGLALLVGAVIGIPGASYLTALHHLVAGKYGTATQVIAVFVFVIISLLLIIIPFAFLELRPEATKARLKRSQTWLLSHAQQLVVAIALLLGAYLTVSGLVRLS